MLWTIVKITPTISICLRNFCFEKETFMRPPSSNTVYYLSIHSNYKVTSFRQVT
nr:hypothetical protein [Dinophyceae sp. MRD-151]